MIFQISLGRHYALKIKPRDSEAKRANVKQEGGFAAVALGLNYLITGAVLYAKLLSRKLFKVNTQPGASDMAEHLPTYAGARAYAALYNNVRLHLCTYCPLTIIS